MFRQNTTQALSGIQSASAADLLNPELTILNSTHAHFRNSGTTLSSATIAAATLSLLLLGATPVWSADARSIALGGSVIANGQGVHGVIENPASLMAMQRRDEKFHFNIGMSGEIRDSGDAIDTLTNDDNEDLIDDVESEIDRLSSTNVQCDPIFGADDNVCLEGTQNLADLSTRVLSILDTLDDETVDARANLDLGVAVSHKKYPFAVNLRISGAAAGTPDISDGDRTYISEFQELLQDDLLTLGEIRNSSYIEANTVGGTLDIQQPEDVLESEGEGAALARVQLGFSLASSFKLGQYDIDAGVTPKISSLTAYDVKVLVSEEFESSTESIEDRFEDSEASEGSFTVDAGVSLALKSQPVRIAAVLRNIVPESIKTKNGYEFETTPQLVIGAVYQRGMLSINGDLALNEAEVDNFETQKVAVGVEFGTKKFAIRGGINSDISRDKDATSLSFGFGLGPLQFGTRLNDLESLEAGAQLAYSF